MYLSVRRSQHALLAIGFFVIMILTVFSTLLYVFSRLHLSFPLALANGHPFALWSLQSGLVWCSIVYPFSLRSAVVLYP